MGIFAVHVNDGEEYINYVHKDNLESWNIITDDEGRVLEKMSFDAWGNMRDPKAWGEECKKKELLFDRGFTGHEHLVDFGLINMNGRLYDPLISYIDIKLNELYPNEREGLNILDFFHAGYLNEEFHNRINEIIEEEQTKYYICTKVEISSVTKKVYYMLFEEK